MATGGGRWGGDRGQPIRCGGQPRPGPGCPAEVQAFAENMLAEVRWRPDPIFMLDVCEAEERLWLVELNGFSCSWLYECDLATVIAKASEMARRAWERTPTAVE